VATVILTILVVVEIIDYCTASLSYPTMLRVVASIIGYTLRPLLIAEILWMVMIKLRRNMVIVFAPVVVNFCIQFTALFCKIAFSYDSHNRFVRGALGYSAHVVSFFLLTLLVVVTCRKYRNLSRTEPFLAIFAGLLLVLATALESIFDYYGMINVTAGVSIVYFYLYMNTQQYKRDALTNALNRQCLSIDSKRGAEKVSAVIVLDLNNLKQINDFFGHEEGDKAIVNVVNCIRNSLIKGCNIYRTGGDEFMILCFMRKKEDIEQMVHNIKSRIAETPYKCALGIAFADNGKSFDELCAAADKEMYSNKMEIKDRKQVN